jgi:hypothetical protein
MLRILGPLMSQISLCGIKFGLLGNSGVDYRPIYGIYETVTIFKYNLYKAEPHRTENIFHIGLISALYKINNTDSSGRNYRICSH